MMPISDVFLMAMKAEKAAYGFYNEIAELYRK